MIELAAETFPCFQLESWKKSDCENRTEKKWHQVVLKRHGGSWVSLCPSRENKTGCRYAELIRLCINTNWQRLRWGSVCQSCTATLQTYKVMELKTENREPEFQQVRSFIYISSDGSQTHTHTLAQNNLCEFWCGMHRTCKNNPAIPGRNGSVKRPEKVSKSFLRKPYI